MRLVVGSDHAGFDLKQLLADHLTSAGHDVVDVGTDDTTSVDYPDYGAAVGRAVVTGRAELGVAVCGSGIGMAIAANKVPGVRAATVHDVTSARLSREHNDANVVCFGQRFTGPQVALDALDAFVACEFQGGRHASRVAKIEALESTGPVVAD
ncbi:MAG: ribose 5-phosphate isomerase B [Acidimicrobiia bacterium]|nr:ribose 5-phosphate isomerase B [Acidimicrobiia bacterium]